MQSYDKFIEHNVLADLTPLILQIDKEHKLKRVNIDKEKVVRELAKNQLTLKINRDRLWNIYDWCDRPLAKPHVLREKVLEQYIAENVPDKEVDNYYLEKNTQFLLVSQKLFSSLENIKEVVAEYQGLTIWCRKQNTPFENDMFLKAIFLQESDASTQKKDLLSEVW